MHPVTIYTTGYCPFCDRAKALFARKKIAYAEIRIDNDSELREKLCKSTGMRTVPQIFINDQCIGGFDDLSRLEQTGKLDTLLAKKAE